MMLPPSHPFTTAQALEHGTSRGQLQRAVEQGLLQRVLLGVYAGIDLPDTPMLRARAAALVLAPTHVVCDRSAAWLHGIDHLDPRSRDVPPRLEVVAMDGTRTRASGTRGGTRALVAEDVMVLDGVPVTTPPRTAADLACRFGRLGAMGVLDQFARHHHVTEAQLRRLLIRFGGRRGVTQFRELINYIDGLAESPAESWVRLMIRDHQLPAPTSQVEVVLPEGTFRLDLAYPHLKVAVEYDGEEHHSNPADRARDLARRAALARAGWHVIVVRKDGLSGTGEDRWTRELRVVLADRVGSDRPRYARAEGSGVPRWRGSWRD